jgi:hypothetical protein
LSVELISAIFTGLIGLLSGLGVLLATQRRRSDQDSREVRREYRELQRKLVAALRHIFTLETTLAQRGLPTPERPEILEKDDDDDGSTPQRADAGAPP